MADYRHHDEPREDPAGGRPTGDTWPRQSPWAAAPATPRPEPPRRTPATPVRRTPIPPRPRTTAPVPPRSTPPPPGPPGPPAQVPPRPTESTPVPPQRTPPQRTPLPGSDLAPLVALPGRDLVPVVPPRPRSHRRGMRRWPVALLALVALLAGAVAVAAVRRDDDRRGTAPAAGPGCAGRTTLRLLAAPELLPVLTAAVQRVAPASGGCPTVILTGQEPAEALRQPDRLAGHDAWIPSSSLWLRQAGADRVGYPATGATIARSPLVVAIPRAYATRLGWPAKQPAWTELAGLTYTRQIPKFSMPDPQRDTTGLLATLAVHAAVARATPDAGIAQLRALTFRSRLADPAADPAALLRRMAAQSTVDQAVGEVGLFPATEQALWAYDRAPHQVELVPAYPPDGVVEADYPLALRHGAGDDPARRAIVDRLVAWFAGADGARLLAEHGLRAPTRPDAADVTPAGPGFVARYPGPAALPVDPAQVRATAAQWSGYRRLVFQVLVLVDASGSMNAQVRDRAGRVTTKADLLRQAGVQAAALYGEDTSLSMWMFASPAADSPPTTVVVPFGPVEETVNGVPRRRLLAEAAQNYRAYPAAGTPLFEAVLRANGEMQNRFRPDAVTLIVVLTDGRDEDTRFAMAREAFLARLVAGRDPARPVPVHSIAYGTDADLATLTEIGRATGGQAVASTDPADLAVAMAKIFLAARQGAG